MLTELLMGSSQCNFSICNDNQFNEFFGNGKGEKSASNEKHAIIEKYSTRFASKYPNYLSKVALRGYNYPLHKSPENNVAPDCYRAPLTGTISQEEIQEKIDNAKLMLKNHIKDRTIVPAAYEISGNAYYRNQIYPDTRGYKIIITTGEPFFSKINLTISAIIFTGLQLSFHCLQLATYKNRDMTEIFKC